MAECDTRTQWIIFYYPLQEPASCLFDWRAGFTLPRPTFCSRAVSVARIASCLRTRFHLICVAGVALSAHWLGRRRRRWCDEGCVFTKMVIQMLLRLTVEWSLCNHQLELDLNGNSRSSSQSGDGHSTSNPFMKNRWNTPLVTPIDTSFRPLSSEDTLGQLSREINQGKNSSGWPVPSLF